MKIPVHYIERKVRSGFINNKLKDLTHWRVDNTYAIYKDGRILTNYTLKRVPKWVHNVRDRLIEGKL